MARLSGLLVVCLVGLSTLAGCLGDEAPPAAPALANNTSEEEAMGLITDTPDAKANATATGDFQKSLDDRAHFHDQWSGATEIVVFEGAVASGAALPNGFFDPRPYVQSGAGTATFTIPEGSVVLPETKEILVSLAYDAAPTLKGLRIGWKNAAERYYQNVSEVLAPGSTFTIPTTVAENDIPHTTFSKWEFRLIPDNDAAPAYWNGTAQVTVTIKRDPVLLLAPPHPDHWLEKTSILLYHESFPAKMKWVGLPVFFPEQPEGFGQIELPEGVIVPPHTGAIRVVLNWTNNDATTANFNPRPAVAYAPADTRSYNVPEQVVMEANHFEGLIPVTPRNVDSPYDAVSNWRFVLYLDSDSPSMGGPFGQVATFEGTVEVHLEAIREDAT